MSDEPDVPGTVHRVRALTVRLEQAGAAFAAREGLSATEVRALISLLDRERSGERASPTWLAASIGITTASGTALLDRLERAGHVRRYPRSDDRRRIDVVVTESARRMGWSFFGPLIAATVDVLERRSDEERAAIDRFLDDMLDAVQVTAAEGAGGSPRGPGQEGRLRSAR